MIPYFILFFFVFIAYWQQNQNNKRYFYFLLICCIILTGSRDMIGGYDVYIYGEVFEAPAPFILTFDGFEVGYRWYNVLLKFITNDRYYYFLITAIITYSLQFSTIKKLSPLILFSIFIYFCKFYLMSFVYLRQFLAMSVIWLAIPFIMKKKVVIPSIIILFSYFLHKSSLLFLPMMFLARIKFTKNQLILLALSFFIVFLTPLGELLLGGLAESSDNNKLNHYSNLNSSVNYLYVIEALAIFSVTYSFRNQFYKTLNTTFIYNGMIMYVLITVSSITNATFVRFSWYFFIFVAIGLPYIYLMIKNEKNKSLFKSIVFVYFAAMIIRMLFAWDGGDLIPYKAFYLDTERHGRFDFMEYR